MYVCMYTQFSVNPHGFFSHIRPGEPQDHRRDSRPDTKKNMIAMVYRNHESHLLNISVYES